MKRNCFLDSRPKKLRPDATADSMCRRAVPSLQVRIIAIRDVPAIYRNFCQRPRATEWLHQG
ncbi:MAG TPA: hypothetical protein PKW90_21560, partial [Myxococcota bacterium]|nr:hypothetical protein [Myxococcota bacterium]